MDRRPWRGVAPTRPCGRHGLAVGWSRVCKQHHRAMSSPVHRERPRRHRPWIGRRFSNRKRRHSPVPQISLNGEAQTVKTRRPIRQRLWKWPNAQPWPTRQRLNIPPEPPTNRRRQSATRTPMPSLAPASGATGLRPGIFGECVRTKWDTALLKLIVFPPSASHRRAKGGT